MSPCYIVSGVYENTCRDLHYLKRAIIRLYINMFQMGNPLLSMPLGTEEHYRVITTTVL